MDFVAEEMKQIGVYVARQLSFKKGQMANSDEKLLIEFLTMDKLLIEIFKLKLYPPLS